MTTMVMTTLLLQSPARAARPTDRGCELTLRYDLTLPRGRPSRPRALIKIKDVRDADERFPEAPGIGYRVIRLSRSHPPHADPRVGRWMIVPVNEPFALDTYTSLDELNALHAQTARVGVDERRRFITEALRLPARVTEAMDWSALKTGRAIEQRLGAHLWSRGRRLHCYDVEGRIY